MKLLAKPKWMTIPDHKVIATVKSGEGNCSWRHEKDDTFGINCYDTAGLCGSFQHDIFPYIAMLQFGGGFPWDDPGVGTVECMDRANAVILELRREK